MDLSGISTFMSNILGEQDDYASGVCMCLYIPVRQDAGQNVWAALDSAVQACF